MAMSRYDTRKQVILEESNAIGTTFLRAQLLPEPPRKEISNLLRRYVEVPLEFYEAGNDQKLLREARNKTEQLQNQLWAYVILSIIIAAVIMVIIDLDRPGAGLIKVSQQRMLDLRESLSKF
jgi:hypothetical protein